MRNVIFYIIMLSIVVSCKSKTNDSHKEYRKLVIDSIYYFQDRVLEYGDTNSYHEIKSYNIDTPHYPDFMYYALIMSDKYNYTPAYYDVYYCLFNSFENPDNLGMKLRNMAIDYLKIAARRKLPEALNDLGQLYIDGKYIKQDTILGNKLIREANSQ